MALALLIFPLALQQLTILRLAKHSANTCTNSVRQGTWHSYWYESDCSTNLVHPEEEHCDLEYVVTLIHTESAATSTNVTD